MINVVKDIIKKSDHKFDFLDLGGGMGVKYNNKNKSLNYKKYNLIIKKFLKKNNI